MSERGEVNETWRNDSESVVPPFPAAGGEEGFDMEELTSSILQNFLPLIICFGSLGNILSVMVFFSTKLRKLSSSYYLSALAVSDTGFLLCTLIPYLQVHDIQLYAKEGVCQASTYLAQVFGFLSPWFIVAFTVERFIAVRYPLKRNSMCTVARAKLVLCCLSALSLLVSLPSFFMIGAFREVRNFTEANGETHLETFEFCRLEPGQESTAELWNHFDTLLTLVIPFLIIVILNTLISRAVCRVARVRRSMTKSSGGGGGGGGAGGGGGGGRPTQKQRTASSQTKVTEMLLVVSTVFIVLNLPSYAFRMYIYVTQKGESERGVVALQHLAQLFFYLNFGINFVLYCVSGQNFRRALFTLFCARLRRRSETSQVTVVSEFNTRSASSRRTMTVNGAWREAHEMLPINRGH